MPDDPDRHDHDQYLSPEFEAVAPPVPGQGPPRGSRWALPAAGVVYLAIAVALWWQVWSGHPAGTSTCECGDPSLFIWFFEWPAYAISHGHFLFFSSVNFHGRGLNVLANTSTLGLSVPMVPVTWLFGPVASVNVVSTLGPALSALSLFWVSRRWIRWQPASFVAGLIYGFSPFVLTNAAYDHLTMTFLVVPPLMLACLDELLVRHRHRPRRVGVVLGLLVAYQFFVSTEMLLITLVMMAIGLIVVAVYAFYAHPERLGAVAPAAGRGLATGAVMATVLLAYPVWYAVDGPDRFAGPVWPSLALTGGYSWNAYFETFYAPASNTTAKAFGYLGLSLPSPAFVGLGVPALLLAGLVIWRKDRRLWIFGALAFVASVLSLGRKLDQPSIWWVVAKLPLFDDVGQERFAPLCVLFLALMVGIVLDYAYAHQRPRILAGADAGADSGADAGAGGRSTAIPGTLGSRLRPGLSSIRARLPGANAWAVASLALIPVLPILWVTVPRLPLSVEPDYVPRWFTQVAPHLPPDQVVLTYPPPFSLFQDAMTWQALGDRDEHFVMAGGGGPESESARAGKQAAAQSILSNLAVPLPQEIGTPSELATVRRALAAWGVTMVVVPRSLHRSYYFAGTYPDYDAGFMTAVLGERPTFTAGAWVWTSVAAAPPVLRVSSQAIPTCYHKQHGSSSKSRPMAVVDCVWRAAAARGG